MFTMRKIFIKKGIYKHKLTHNTIRDFERVSGLSDLICFGKTLLEVVSVSSFWVNEDPDPVRGPMGIRIELLIRIKVFIRKYKS